MQTKEQKRMMKKILGIKEISEEYKERQRRNSKFRRQLKKKITKPELILKRWFEENNIRVIFQKGFLTPFHRIVDFYLPKFGLIIEVDGGYHKNIQSKDKLKDDLWLRKRGLRTLRITNEQVYQNKFAGMILSYFAFYKNL